MSTSIGEAEILELIQRAAWEVDLKRYDGLTLEQELSALGLDSIVLMEVLGFIEDELQIHLPQERLSSVRTIGDLVRVVEEATKGA